LGWMAFSNGNKICIDTGFMWHILACPARGWPSPRKHGNLLRNRKGGGNMVLAPTFPT
jgi:hypothetical protein